MYQFSKTYGHELGISASFRQWRAQNNCKFIHGYALSFKFTFQTEKFTEFESIQSFIDSKPLKEMLMGAFDHKLLIAKDDPYLAQFLALDRAGLAQVRIVQSTGCESFAKLAFDLASALYNSHKIFVVSCEVHEHCSNSALYMSPNHA